MENIKFKINSDFITLVQLLKYECIIGSGGEINDLLDDKLILYNDSIEYQKRKKCYKGDIIKIGNNVMIEII